jgi:DNA phosphorothioation-associated putative methyltransferase
MTVVARHKTAMHRTRLSKPVRLAQDSGLIEPATTFFDYGCGRGGDLAHLRAMGVHCSGWDPVHSPQTQQCEADVINLGYVVNVIEDTAERADALRKAWKLARRVLVVSARLTVEARGTNHREFADGCLTGRDTFQKFFTQHELREWIDSTLQVESVAAAPGVFFVFRDESQRQALVSARYRRSATVPRQRVSDQLFQEHQQFLDVLMSFFARRGRLPEPTEADLTRIEEVFGSVRRAFGVVQRVTGTEQWEQIRDDRTQDCLVYLALSKFGRRPKLSELPVDIQFDIKAFFGSYTAGCEQADALLFSAGKSPVIDDACKKAGFGKLTNDALYVHSAGIPQLPAVLRVYEGCARNLIGTVEAANIVKLHRQKPKVSYLAYPEFDADPHPALNGALVVPLDSFDVKFWNYADSPNPPILHRKEEFVPQHYPGRNKFSRLTEQEVRNGLFEETIRIGQREEWKRLLMTKGLTLRGHRLIRQSNSPLSDLDSTRNS